MGGGVEGRASGWSASRPLGDARLQCGVAPRQPPPPPPRADRGRRAAALQLLHAHPHGPFRARPRRCPAQQLATASEIRAWATPPHGTRPGITDGPARAAPRRRPGLRRESASPPHSCDPLAKCCLHGGSTSRARAVPRRRHARRWVRAARHGRRRRAAHGGGSAGTFVWSAGPAAAIRGSPRRAARRSRPSPRRPHGRPRADVAPRRRGTGRGAAAAAAAVAAAAVVGLHKRAGAMAAAAVSRSAQPARQGPWPPAPRVSASPPHGG